MIIGALLQLLTLVGNPALTLAVRIISLVLAVLSIVIVVLEFLFYVPFIDKFCRKRRRATYMRSINRRAT